MSAVNRQQVSQQKQPCLWERRAEMAAAHLAGPRSTAKLFVDLSIPFAQDLGHEVQVILRVGVVMCWQRSESLVNGTRHT